MSFEYHSLLLTRLETAEGMAESSRLLLSICVVRVLRTSVTDVSACHLSICLASKFVATAHIGAKEGALGALFCQMVLEQLVWDAGTIAAVDALKYHARGPIDSVFAIDRLNWSEALCAFVEDRTVDEVRLRNYCLLLLAFAIPLLLNVAAASADECSAGTNLRFDAKE